MKSFHNDPEIKDKYLDRIHSHFAMDEIIKGIYWEDGKGCAVGCTLHSSEHDNYEIELGIPVVLAYLEDKIFENLPNELSKIWPARFLEAIPIGVDLELIWPKFAKWLLIDPHHGVIRFNNSQRIVNIVNLFQKWIDGNKPPSNEWEEAAAAAYASAAHDAALAAARASASTASTAAATAYAARAAYAAAADGARAAARAADAAYDATYDAVARAAAAGRAATDAANAARAAARAAAVYDAHDATAAIASAVKSNYYIIMSEKILELLRDAK